MKIKALIRKVKTTYNIQSFAGLKWLINKTPDHRPSISSKWTK